MKRFIFTYIIHARALLCVTFNMGFPQKSAIAWLASCDTRIEIDTHTIIRPYIPQNQNKPTRTYTCGNKEEGAFYTSCLT